MEGRGTLVIVTGVDRTCVAFPNLSGSAGDSVALRRSAYAEVKGIRQKLGTVGDSYALRPPAYEEVKGIRQIVGLR